MDTQHSNPLCRVASIGPNNARKETPDYDKEKYKEMLLDAAETVLGYFGFDRTLYGDKKIYQSENSSGFKKCNRKKKETLK